MLNTNEVTSKKVVSETTQTYDFPVIGILVMTSKRTQVVLRVPVTVEDYNNIGCSLQDTAESRKEVSKGH
jgi:hypothetical protein